MKLSVKALVFTMAIIWGGAMFLISVSNHLSPGYGIEFLNMVSSIYPGYQPEQGINSIVTGTLYAAIDGAIGGAIIAWVYNWFV